MTKHIDLEQGQKFNYLTVINLHHTETRFYNGKKRKLNLKYYLCRCDCGREVIVEKSHLRKKIDATVSCGCIHKTHGLTKKTPLYSVWAGMKRRCFNKNEKCYKNYGGRGITICELWKNDFLSFYNWSLNNGYKKGLTIDRINNDGNYEPANCRWIDSHQNKMNRRNTVKTLYNGKEYNLLDLCKIAGEKYNTLYMRLKRNGHL